MPRTTPFSKPASQAERLNDSVQVAYVRPFWAGEETPEEAPRGVKATDLYALHGADGERLAVFTDRNMAFTVARRNNLTPVNAH